MPLLASGCKFIKIKGDSLIFFQDMTMLSHLDAKNVVVEPFVYQKLIKSLAKLNN